MLFRWALKTVKYFRAPSSSHHGGTYIRFTIHSRSHTVSTHASRKSLDCCVFDDCTFGENWSVEDTQRTYARVHLCPVSLGCEHDRTFYGLVTALSTLATHRAASTSTNNGKLLVLLSTQEFLPSQA